MNRKAILAIVGISFPMSPAIAQGVVDAGEVVFENWSYDSLYSMDAWSVDDLFGRSVTGGNGERIGDVEDLVLNDTGEVYALIAEVGGVWDIGDTHVSIPWNQVELFEDGAVSVPVTEETVGDYDLFASSGLPQDANPVLNVVEDVDDEVLGSGLWRASELMGDYVRLLNEEDTWQNFGYISDLMIDDGAIAATIVSSAGRYGPGMYAYPYRRASGEPYGTWQPNATAQDIPLLVDEVTSGATFDAEQM